MALVYHRLARAQIQSAFSLFCQVMVIIYVFKTCIIGKFRLLPNSQPELVICPLTFGKNIGIEEGFTLKFVIYAK